MKTLQFKFRDKIDKNTVHKIIHELMDQGAADVRRLFPDETDDELTTLYIADFKSNAQGRRLLGILDNSKAIEFSEGEIKRKLIP